MSGGEDFIDPLNIDNQQFTGSLAGNILTLMLENGGTPLVFDLSVYLDDTDDQTITQFAVVGPNVVLTIEDGNTVSIPLTSFQDGTGTDDQAISLLANILSLEDGGTVDLSPYLDNTDSQTLTATNVGGVTTAISISGGNTIPVTTEEIGYTWAAGHIQGNNGATLHSVGSHNASSNPQNGRYTVTFDQPHPNGADYAITLGVNEDVNNRDGRVIQIIDGTRTANGFQVQILTGDNGGTADTFVEEDWSYAVHHELTVLTGIG